MKERGVLAVGERQLLRAGPPLELLFAHNPNTSVENAPGIRYTANTDRILFATFYFAYG